MSVVPLTVSIPDAKQNVVELIEALLEEAKSGTIQTFGAVAIDAGGGIRTSFAAGGLPHAHHLVAGAYYLLCRVERNAGLDP